MCYTIEKNLTREELEKRYGAKFKTDRPYSPGKRVSAFSLPEVPVISADNPKEISLFQWGLIPFWVKDLENANQIRLKTFNAKAESLLEKPSFRHTLKRQRCLVLTNGFYEWQHVGKEKIPFYITKRDDIALTLGGLYDTWVNKETGEVFNTFSIITTQANPMMEKIHNTKKRMPLILKTDDEACWIDAEMPVEKAIKLLKPFNEEFMIARELDKKDFKEHDVIKQGKLFM